MTDSKAAADAEMRRSDPWLMLKIAAFILCCCLMAAPWLIGMSRFGAEIKQERHRLRMKPIITPC